jgi:hypothetical protein
MAQLLSVDGDELHRLGIRADDAVDKLIVKDVGPLPAGFKVLKLNLGIAECPLD